MGSILQDREFALSREAIIASRKKLRKEGKETSYIRASEPFESEDFECAVWESGALGDSDPETLQNSVWVETNTTSLNLEI